MPMFKVRHSEMQAFPNDKDNKTGSHCVFLVEPKLQCLMEEDIQKIQTDGRYLTAQHSTNVGWRIFKNTHKKTRNMKKNECTKVFLKKENKAKLFRFVILSTAHHFCSFLLLILYFICDIKACQQEENKSRLIGTSRGSHSVL